MKKIKKSNDRKLGKQKEVTITGYWISKWCGFLYDKTWVTVFNITRLIILLIFTILHLFMAVLLYKDMSILEKVLITNFGIVYINSLLMVLPLIYNSKKNILYCSIIRTEFQEPKIKLSPKQLEVKEYTKRFVRNFAYNVTFYLYASLAMNFVRRCIFEGISLKILPVKGWVPFEVNSLFRYIAVCIIQVLMSINGMSAHIGFLIIFVTHSKSLCEQFDILSIHIRESFENVYFGERMKSFERNCDQEKYINSRMKYAVYQHGNLLRYFNLYQEIYGMFLFIFAIGTGAMICTAVYVITDPASSISLVIISFACVFIPEVIVIGIYCWFGQQVTNKYLKIQEAAYNVPWYTQTLSTQKLLLNILTACQRERIVMGGGIQQFSLLGFSELLQVSFSYFNVLKVIRQ